MYSHYIRTHHGSPHTPWQFQWLRVTTRASKLQATSACPQKSVSHTFLRFSLSLCAYVGEIGLMTQYANKWKLHAEERLWRVGSVVMFSADESVWNLGSHMCRGTEGINEATAFWGSGWACLFVSCYVWVSWALARLSRLTLTDDLSCALWWELPWSDRLGNRADSLDREVLKPNWRWNFIFRGCGVKSLMHSTATGCDEWDGGFNDYVAIKFLWAVNVLVCISQPFDWNTL